MKQIIIFFSLLIMTCISAIGQEYTFKGILLDSATKAPLPYASIKNHNKKLTVISHSDGSFHIRASRSDMLYFTFIGYKIDTLYFQPDSIHNNTETRKIYLKPMVHALKTISIKAEYSYEDYQDDSTQRRLGYLGMNGDHRIPVASRPNSGNFGIGLNLDHFYGREKRKRANIKLLDQMEKEQYVNFRYKASVVKKYTNFTGDDLRYFMEKYRPDYTWLRQHKSEQDLLLFINDAVKKLERKRNHI